MKTNTKLNAILIMRSAAKVFNITADGYRNEKNYSKRKSFIAKSYALNHFLIPFNFELFKNK